ncbi:cytochrome P450 [Streptomyces sp. NPDC046759]|uniref:cytochrome P450 n=1 Tax=Streptomyces sp. NPDC046759 TaxID=3155019 RepID=UPI0033CD90AF
MHHGPQSVRPRHFEAIGALEELTARPIAGFCLGPDCGRVPELVARLQDARAPAAVPWAGRESVLRRRRLRRAGQELEAVPFGRGPRMCLGAHFGTVAMVLATATAVSRYRLAPEPDRTPVFGTRTVLEREGLVFDVSDRGPAAPVR